MKGVSGENAYQVKEGVRVKRGVEGRGSIIHRKVNLLWRSIDIRLGRILQFGAELVKR